MVYLLTNVTEEMDRYTVMVMWRLSQIQIESSPVTDSA